MFTFTPITLPKKQYIRGEFRQVRLWEGANRENGKGHVTHIHINMKVQRQKDRERWNMMDKHGQRRRGPNSPTFDSIYFLILSSVSINSTSKGKLDGLHFLVDTPFSHFFQPSPHSKIHTFIGE